MQGFVGSGEKCCGLSWGWKSGVSGRVRVRKHGGVVGSAQTLPLALFPTVLGMAVMMLDSVFVSWDEDG
ncbi:uncharacterized protein SETTUDRAFT_168540 [Exserohilum turcica Et28A]|uniref:Uncharacterized protein n=1 Tax=Exserohilum turcicum (strain 28A) TaxID=671987 RepID=R0KJF5_EXST2|nr:uncharacterized protein SETTUDRAFT_168540 [Exserohilum turcica Et28A]EOA88112.1 hypothetical protein SETTUDRAFT_168540 [Exserohilum turcica Et28A]